MAAKGNIFMRDDTFFGVCEALGEDFRFNANILRVTLGVLVLWNPVAILSFYAGAGVLVFVSRWLAPNPAQVAAASIPVEIEVPAAAQAEPEQTEEPLAIAA